MKVLIVLFITLCSLVSNSQITADSATTSNETKVIERINLTSGEVALGSSYGGLELVNSSLYSKPYLFTQGRFGVNVFQLPVSINFYYSELGFKGGRANSFTIQFDASRYYRNRNLKLQRKEEFLGNRIDSLETAQTHIGQELVYNSWKPDSKIPEFSYTSPDILDSTNLNQLPIDSLKLEHSNQVRRDSLARCYQTISESIIKAKEELNRVKDLRNSSLQIGTSGKQLFRKQQIKQLKLGNCVPSFSPLTLEGTRIQGIAFTTESSKLHLDIAGGWIARQQPGVLNPADQNPLSNWRRNMLNRDGSIYYARVGYGRQKGSHIYISGFRGKDEMLSGFATDQRERESTNIELEGQWAGTSQVLSFRAAQMVNQPNLVNADLNESSTTNTGDISAFALSHSMQLEKLATTTELSAQWIGSQYYSVGSPFLQSDNASIRGRVSNKKKRWFQPGVIVSYSYNDVRNLSPYGSTIRSTGVEVISQPLSKLILTGSYAPTLITTKTEEGVRKLENSIYAITAMFNESKNNLNWTLTGNVSRVIQLWDSLVIQNMSFLASSSMLIMEKFIWDFSFTSSSLSGLDGQDFHLNSINSNIGYTTKKGAVFMLGGAIFDDKINLTYSYSGSVQFQLFKNCQGQISYDQFPVFESTDLIYATALTMPFLAQARVTYYFSKNSL